MSFEARQVTLSESASQNISIRSALIERVHDSHRRRYWSEVDRESYTCPMGDHPERRSFEVHHINRDWMDGRMVNLVGLCHPCHNRVHRVRNRGAALDEWKAEFETLGGGGQ